MLPTPQSATILRSLLLTFVASLAFPACGVGTLSPSGEDQGGGGNGSGGGGNGDGDDDTILPDAFVPVAEYSMSVSPALGEINLGDQQSFTLSLQSENFSGPVTLDMQGAMAGWEISYSPSQSITLLKNQSTDVVVTITIPTNASDGQAALQFAMDGELGTRNENAALTVANQLVFSIDSGVGLGPHGFSGTYAVRQATKIVIQNNDLSAHRIHSEPHQPNAMGQGQAYEFYFQEPGNHQAYCHEHGGTGKLTFTVE